MLLFKEWGPEFARVTHLSKEQNVSVFVRYVYEVMITKLTMRKKALHSLPEVTPEETRIKQFSRILL